MLSLSSSSLEAWFGREEGRGGEGNRPINGPGVERREGGKEGGGEGEGRGRMDFVLPPIPALSTNQKCDKSVDFSGTTTKSRSSHQLSMRDANCKVSKVF